MKGLLFKPWKAQAIHESNPGKEWQTRRIIRFPYHNKLGIWEPTHITPEGLKDRFGQPANFAPYWGMWHTRTGKIITCPYSIGEQVYIKETHRIINGDGNPNDFGVEYKSGQINWWSDNGGRFNYPIDEKWRSSLFLPADLARTVVTITDIQAQRVQDISEEDAQAEGMNSPDVLNAILPHYEIGEHYTEANYLPEVFRQLWNSIHGEGAWERNDWVWKYSFIRRGGG